MSEFIETEIPGYGIARYTQPALETVTSGATSYRVPELRRLAASQLARRGIAVSRAFQTLRRESVLVVLAGIRSDQEIADLMEREATFTVIQVTVSSTQKQYTLRADMSRLGSLTVIAEYDPRGRIQRAVTDTGAPVIGEARVRAVRAVRDYRIEHESPLSVTGAAGTSYGPSYSVIARLDGEEIEVGYVFTAVGGEYVDDLAIAPAGYPATADTRGAWYKLVHAYRAKVNQDQPEVMLPCSMCLSSDHQPGTTGAFTSVTRGWGEHPYVRPDEWWYWTEIYVPKLCSWSGCGCPGPHGSHDIDSLRQHAHEVLRSFPLVSKVRILIVFKSPENKPSTTQDCIVTGPVVETIAR